MINLPVRITPNPLWLPMAGSRVRAGFPSPAEDFGCKPIDLTSILITHPQATFLLRVRGDSMREAGIFDNDVLVVDKAIKPRHDHIVVAVVDGEFTVKRLYQRAGRMRLRGVSSFSVQ
jgi:DNA polymerase V